MSTRRPVSRTRGVDRRTSPSGMMSQVYILDDLWPKNTEWFVIGGPANQNEAQYVKDKYPGVKCFGVEPHEGSHLKQLSGRDLEGTELPFPGELVGCALWSHDDTNINNPSGALNFGSPRGGNPLRSSLQACTPENPPDAGGEKIEYEYTKVRARTLDSLSAEYGPFNNVVLWLDIEYAELEALKGASKLLDRTLVVNVETFSHLNLSKINDLLTAKGFYLYRLWNAGQTPGKDAQDYVYVRAGRFGG